VGCEPRSTARAASLNLRSRVGRNKLLPTRMLLGLRLGRCGTVSTNSFRGFAANCAETHGGTIGVGSWSTCMDRARQPRAAEDAIGLGTKRPSEWAPPLGHFMLMIPIGAGLLILQSFAHWLRSLHLVLTGRAREVDDAELRSLLRRSSLRSPFFGWPARRGSLADRAQEILFINGFLENAGHPRAGRPERRPVDGHEQNWCAD
jgi:hypothetical protein